MKWIRSISGISGLHAQRHLAFDYMQHLCINHQAIWAARRYRMRLPLILLVWHLFFVFCARFVRLSPNRWRHTKRRSSAEGFRRMMVCSSTSRCALDWLMRDKRVNEHPSNVSNYVPPRDRRRSYMRRPISSINQPDWRYRALMLTCKVEWGMRDNWDGTEAEFEFRHAKYSTYKAICCNWNRNKSPSKFNGFRLMATIETHASGYEWLSLLCIRLGTFSQLNAMRCKLINNIYITQFRIIFFLFSLFFCLPISFLLLRVWNSTDNGGSFAVTNGITLCYSTSEMAISTWPDCTRAIYWCKQWPTPIALTTSHTSHLPPTRPSAITPKVCDEKLASTPQVSRRDTRHRIKFD